MIAARRLWRSPALRFLALGAALYAIESRSHRTPDRAVVITRSTVAALRAELTARLHRPPTRAELTAAVDLHTDDARLYREAIDRRVWEGDPVLRQRLVERAAWTLRGEPPTAPPTPADLARTLARHPERYAIPATVSFTQVFVSRAAHPADGLAVMASLTLGDHPDALGDPAPFGREVTDRNDTRLAAEYGDAFAEVVRSLSDGAWSPPIETRFGWHRVRVTRRIPAATLTVAQAGARLVADWRDDQRADAEEAARQRLRRERPVRYEPGAAP